uniref:MurR/RpiR family transcriptional regulator n=1 Tax=uncultured Thiotrichaceae bacterium TaxID=298394 RepID=A0A6S6UGP2_9GAMM|nr:MAG: MurR/RpiR family transcriptional regulator [uncultured Thiotrichaceae bacterium]
MFLILTIASATVLRIKEWPLLIRDHIAIHHADLTPQLRVAANYVAEHPAEVATRSLRTVATHLNIPPVTFTRLSKALGLGGYQGLKELCSKSIKQQSQSFSDRAKNLQISRCEIDKTPLFYQHTRAITDNIHEMDKTIDVKKLQQVADEMNKANRVYLVGALASAHFSRFWSYIARLAFSNWYVVNEGEGRLASTINTLDTNDFVVIISKAPHAEWSILAAREIRQTGAQLLVLTDTISCPAIQYSDFHFAISDGSPQFFSSYVSLLVLIETLMGMVIARAGEDAPRHIEAIEKNNYRLGKYWQE